MACQGYHAKNIYGYVCLISNGLRCACCIFLIFSYINYMYLYLFCMLALGWSLVLRLPKARCWSIHDVRDLKIFSKTSINAVFPRTEHHFIVHRWTCVICWVFVCASLIKSYESAFWSYQWENFKNFVSTDSCVW